MTPRIFLGIAPGLADSAIAVVSADAQLTGEPVRHWNRKYNHFEFTTDTVDSFVCGEALREPTPTLAARIRKMVAAARREKIPVRVVIDRSAISDPMVWDLWRAATKQPRVKPGEQEHDVSCMVIDIDTDARVTHNGVRVISMKGHEGSGHERVHARDIAGAVVWLQCRDRVKVSPKAREGSALLGELDGFNGQADRRLARALAVALYAGYASPTGAVPTGVMPEGEEREMMDLMMRGDDDGDELDE